MTNKVFIIVTKGEVGGAQMSVLNLARGLEERGVGVTVGFGRGEFLKNELEKSAIAYTNFKYLKRTHNPFINLLFIWEVKKYLDKNKFDVIEAFCAHRVGHLQIGDLAVWILVTAKHRKQAFLACEFIIDSIKKTVPIWKKEHYSDKSIKSQWVYCTEDH